MPLVAHRHLDSLQRIQAEGHEVLSMERACSQEIRELHIGLLNMMPDGALQATERQFLRLISNANRIAQIYVHIFTVSGVPRSAATQAYIEQHYERFEDLKQEGLDAVIFTGTNPTQERLLDEAYWPQVQEILDWAQNHTVSILCSCLASHLALQHQYGIQRHRGLRKRFGVFPHRVVAPHHPLVANLNSRFDMPHSRWNDVPESAFLAHNLQVLVRDEQGHVAVATSADGFRQVYLQGHPEYDRLSLLKEFCRDLQLYMQGQLKEAPFLPEHYCSAKGMDLVANFMQNKETNISILEEALLHEIDVTWRDTAKAFFSNWLGLVYQLTHYDRQKQFMDGINPQDPLGFLTKE